MMRAETSVLLRYNELSKQGMLYERRLPKVHEPSRIKAHWDYLLEEMNWLAMDFASETKWKRCAAKKCAKMIEKYFNDKLIAERKAQKEEALRVQIATFIAKEIRNFWLNTQKLVEFKEMAKIEELRNRARDQHLSFIVDQTEKISKMLASSLNPAEETSDAVVNEECIDMIDHEFEWLEEEEEEGENDDEDSKSEDSLMTTSNFSEDEEITPKEKEEEGENDDEDSKSEDSLMTTSNFSEDEEITPKFYKDQVEVVEEDIKLMTRLAEPFQPTGYTLSSTKVVTKVPILLKHTLREYQHIGLDWLVAMYDKKLNGILADEMGLGKTIQTIALLAHLACEKGNWGPHLIIVPTSVMLNWEMEFKKWCPGFNVLTYYGSVKEREDKRKGWTKPNTFHVCITSYKLVIQDHQSFRRKRWRYLVLDEAQNIKNLKSRRWERLSDLNVERRLLLTGTALSNERHELSSKVNFIMPSISQAYLYEWVSRDVKGMLQENNENENMTKRLQKVLRPFVLRRLKCEVEKQLPQKYEHVILCRLSKRQRFLYEEFMSRTKTRETLESGNLLSVINILMQLRKVCNHPNLFESRPIISPLQTEGIEVIIPSLVWNMFNDQDLKTVSYPILKPYEFNFTMGNLAASTIRSLRPPKSYITIVPSVGLSSSVIEEEPYAYGPEFNLESVKIPLQGTSICPWKGQLLARAPQVKSKIPVFMTFDIEPTELLRDAEFLKGLITESKNNTLLRGKKRKPDAGSETLKHPSKITKLSTGKVKIVGTSSGHHQVLLSGSRLATGLPSLGPLITETAAEKPPPTNLSQTPLTYSESIVGVPMHQVEVDEVNPSRYRDSILEAMKKEGYLPVPTFETNLITEETDEIHEQYACNKENPFVKLKLEMDNNERCGALKRKYSFGDESDEYEDSEEEVTLPLPTVEVRTTPSLPEKKQVEPKREFRVEDMFEDNMYRKRRLLRKQDVYGGSTWLGINGVSAENFEDNEIQFRRLIERKFVIERLQKLNASRCNIHPFFGLDTVDSCSACDVPDPQKKVVWKQGDFEDTQRRDFDKFGYFNYGYNEVESVRRIKVSELNWNKNHPSNVWRFTNTLASFLGNPDELTNELIRVALPSLLYIPSVTAPLIQYRVFHPSSSPHLNVQNMEVECRKHFKNSIDQLHPVMTRMMTQFPDPRLIQYDSGKLQQLDLLLRRLISEDHRVLIFTQMTKMLDVLESFLNYHGYIYLRLDGSTKIDQRQLLMEKFNTDRKIFCFILSTRSGGIGVNLTGADTVIFYDSDWNPTMDAQAQDRCHRIGQTRDVHIYRLVSERTIEENILLKSNQKKLLGELAIEGGHFTTAYFKKHTIRDLFDIQTLDNHEDSNGDRRMRILSSATDSENGRTEVVDQNKTLLLESALAAVEDDTDVQAARTVRAEAAAELAEFDENIPLEELAEEKEYEEPSRVAQEFDFILNKLSPIERYAIRVAENFLSQL